MTIEEGQGRKQDAVEEKGTNHKNNKTKKAKRGKGILSFDQAEGE